MDGVDEAEAEPEASPRYVGTTEALSVPQPSVKVTSCRAKVPARRSNATSTDPSVTTPRRRLWPTSDNRPFFSTNRAASGLRCKVAISTSVSLNTTVGP